MILVLMQGMRTFLKVGLSMIFRVVLVDSIFISWF